MAEPVSPAPAAPPETAPAALPFDFGPLDLRPLEAGAAGAGSLDFGALDLGPLDLGPFDPGLFEISVAQTTPATETPAADPPAADLPTAGEPATGPAMTRPASEQPAAAETPPETPPAPVAAEPLTLPTAQLRTAEPGAAVSSLPPAPFVLDMPPPLLAAARGRPKAEPRLRKPAESATEAPPSPPAEAAQAEAAQAPEPPQSRVRPHVPVHADAVSRLSGEDALIHRAFAPLASHEGAFGLTDDAAAIAVPPSHEVVATTDTLVAGVHFFPDDPPEAIARKALRVNLSDLAAKAADPLGFLLSIALPEGIRPEWLDAFARGLADDSKKYRIPLFGGDTVRTTGPMVISITALGTAKPGEVVRRAGAQPGDWVMVTGTIGDAALGLMLRKHLGLKALNRLGTRDKAHLTDRYLLPQPRLRLAAALRLHATAAMDISDGLAGDLAKLCAVSGVGARIETALLPLSPAAAAAIETDPRLLERVVSGGDDYEILMTVPSDDLDAFVSAATRAGVAVTAIGEITAGPGLPVLYGPDGPMKLKQMSFSHF
ncbi:thiamine-phosphate kinase [Blastochloris sulfoviridis]|nr:thiamine-phosphate kinase [Blastochloris sulfoviridis]